MHFIQYVFSVTNQLLFSELVCQKIIVLRIHCTSRYEACPTSINESLTLRRLHGNRGGYGGVVCLPWSSQDKRPQGAEVAP